MIIKKRAIFKEIKIKEQIAQSNMKIFLKNHKNTEIQINKIGIFLLTLINVKIIPFISLTTTWKLSSIINFVCTLILLYSKRNCKKDKGIVFMFEIKKVYQQNYFSSLIYFYYFFHSLFLIFVLILFKILNLKIIS